MRLKFAPKSENKNYNHFTPISGQASARKCEDYCKLGVYELEQHEGKTRSIVRNPNSCVVLCTGCDGICPVGAIKHQSKKETHEAIKALRNIYSVKSEKRAKIGANPH